MVLDLETTGGSAQRDTITEIGAVKVRGGERIGELATLVDPGTGMPPNIVALTGITTAMVTGAPRLPAVLPSVLEFLAGCGAGGAQRAVRRRVPARRLRAARAAVAAAAGAVHGPARPRRADPRGGPQRAARRAGPSCSAPPPAPTHRALADARATVEVLHRLLERVGNLGVQSLEELLDAGPRRRSAPADGASAPQAPPRRGRAVRARGVPVPRGPRRGALRRHQRRPAPPGAQLLHRGRAPQADPRHGRAGRAGRHGRRARTRWRPRCASCG